MAPGSEAHTGGLAGAVAPAGDSWELRRVQSSQSSLQEDSEFGRSRTVSDAAAAGSSSLAAGDLSAAFGLPAAETSEEEELLLAALLDVGDEDAAALVGSTEASRGARRLGGYPSSLVDGIDGDCGSPGQASTSLLGGLPQHRCGLVEVEDSPMHGLRSVSIDEPLLVLDEDQGSSALVQSLRAELAELRGESKAEASAMSAMLSDVEQERDELRQAYRKLAQENSVLTLQLQNHHGIMAQDWEQTLDYKERLRSEEATAAQLAEEVRHLRNDNAAKAEEAVQLRKDAGRWQLLRNAQAAKSLEDVTTHELEGTLDAVVPALARLQVEVRSRARKARQQLAAELDLRLCAVCRDEEKCVLFLPCRHVCVCETCRGRLRPYRCPMCQEPVQQHVTRIHY